MVPSAQVRLWICLRSLLVPTFAQIPWRITCFFQSVESLNRVGESINHSGAAEYLQRSTLAFKAVGPRSPLNLTTYLADLLRSDALHCSTWLGSPLRAGAILALCLVHSTYYESVRAPKSKYSKGNAS